MADMLPVTEEMTYSAVSADEESLWPVFTASPTLRAVAPPPFDAAFNSKVTIFGRGRSWTGSGAKLYSSLGFTKPKNDLFIIARSFVLESH
jgi:hypothetical protein